MILEIIQKLKEWALGNSNIGFGNIEQAYQEENYEKLFAELSQLFNDDFLQLVSFCKNNGIVLNFEGALENAFLEHLSQKNRIVNASRISGLEQMMLVRKTKGLPDNDKIIAATSFLTEKEDVENLQYDGKEYFFDIDIPVGKPTISFMMNQEVISHEYGDWDTCDTIILQPLTEKLYNAAIGLNPVDTLFAYEVDLEDYFVICDSVEKANEVMRKNDKATPIVFQKNKINGAGNQILRMLNIPLPYKLYANAYMDGTISMESYYSEDLLSKFPKLINCIERGPGNQIHDSHLYLKDICRVSQIIDFLIKLADSEDDLDLAINKLSKSLIKYSNYFSYILSTKSKGVIFSKVLPAKYTSVGKFLDAMPIANSNHDPQLIFEELIKDVEINEENKDAILRLKEIVISKVLNFNEDIEQFGDFHKSEKYGKLVFELFLLRKLVTSNFINKKFNSSLRYDVPLVYYDFSKFDEFCDAIVQKSFDLGKDRVDCMVESRFNPTIIGMKNSRVDDSFTSNFIKRLEDVKNIQKRDDKTREIIKLGLDFNIPEDALPDFAFSIQEFINDGNFWDLMDVITTLKFHNPELVKQANAEMTK